KTTPEDGEQEEVREGFNPDEPDTDSHDRSHNLEEPFTVGDDDDEDTTSNNDKRDEAGHAQPWEHRDYSDNRDESNPGYGSFEDERNAWGGNGRQQ
ncbi:hypothetical protein LTR28_010311, partial [Elasticomyces elasticus]